MKHARVLFITIMLGASAMLLGVSNTAYSYEVPTHEELTEKAATRSVLDQYVLRDLGLVNIETRLQGKKIIEWMRYGAKFEDSKIPYNIQLKLRFLNHFYNPLYGQGFSDPDLLEPWSTGLPSPSWGIEDQGDIDGQDYSLKDGYQWLLNGLTLPNKSDREEYLAKTFRTLGHVVHLVQDAGQPQHTRNDDHWRGSLYETVANDEMKNKTLPYDGYDIVQFSKARDYFHTLPPGTNNVLQGKGLAEYSNRGFVTAHTNFTGSLGGGSSEFPISTFINNPSFPTPNGNGVIFSTLDIHNVSLLGSSKPNLHGDISFVGTNVVDTYDPSKTQVNPRTSSYSVFDADLEKYNLGGAKFTYNRFNAKEAHKFLIPRAVSYSAGLINWFFRGKIDMVKDPANPGHYLIKNLGTEPLQGTFTLYYDDTSDVRHDVPGAQWSTTSLIAGGQLTAGATITVPAFMPPTDAKTANTYMLVFKGKIGADIDNSSATDSIAAKTVEDFIAYDGVLTINWENWSDSDNYYVERRMYVFVNRKVYVFNGNLTYAGYAENSTPHTQYDARSYPINANDWNSAPYMVELTFSTYWLPYLEDPIAEVPVGLRTAQGHIGIDGPSQLASQTVWWSNFGGSQAESATVGYYHSTSNAVWRSKSNGVTDMLGGYCSGFWAGLPTSIITEGELSTSQAEWAALKECASTAIANRYSIPISEWIFVE